MTIKSQLEKLHDIDIWSLMLFTLYKVKDVPEYSTLSELAYILDKKNLLKLCEYCGGSYIRVPTKEELEDTIYALLLYQLVDIESRDIESALNELDVHDKVKRRYMKENYQKVVKIMNNYKFTPRSRI